jgi:hypothetical protein
MRTIGLFLIMCLATLSAALLFGPSEADSAATTV